MSEIPSQDQLRNALKAAANAHHEFQENALNGVHHDQWPMWYAAYVLGRLGDFTTPTLLTHWLAEVTDEHWIRKAAQHILHRLQTV